MERDRLIAWFDSRASGAAEPRPVITTRAEAVVWLRAQHGQPVRGIPPEIRDLVWGLWITDQRQPRRPALQWDRLVPWALPVVRKAVWR